MVLDDATFEEVETADHFHDQEGGDQGAPIVLGDPESSASRALFAIAKGVREQLGALSSR